MDLTPPTNTHPTPFCKFYEKHPLSYATASLRGGSCSMAWNIIVTFFFLIILIMILFTATIVIIRVGEKEDILKWVHRSPASLAFLQLLMDQLAATLPQCPHYHHYLKALRETTFFSLCMRIICIYAHIYAVFPHKILAVGLCDITLHTPKFKIVSRPLVFQCKIQFKFKAIN